MQCGATLADTQPQDDVRVLLDPVGHPFCLVLQSAGCGAWPTGQGAPPPPHLARRARLRSQGRRGGPARRPAREQAAPDEGPLEGAVPVHAPTAEAGDLTGGIEPGHRFP